MSTLALMALVALSISVAGACDGAKKADAATASASGCSAKADAAKAAEAAKTADATTASTSGCASKAADATTAGTKVAGAGCSSKAADATTAGTKVAGAGCSSKAADATTAGTKVAGAGCSAKGADATTAGTKVAGAGCSSQTAEAAVASGHCKSAAATGPADLVIEAVRMPSGALAVFYSGETDATIAALQAKASMSPAEMGCDIAKCMTTNEHCKVEVAKTAHGLMMLVTSDSAEVLDGYQERYTLAMATEHAASESGE